MEHRAERLDNVLEMIEQGNYLKAINICKVALAEEKDAHFLILLINCYVDLDKLEEAEEKIELLENYEWDESNIHLRDQCLYSYYLHKSQQTWTGSQTADNGDNYRYPENSIQIEDAKHYLNLADQLEIDNEELFDYRKTLAELLEDNSAEPENATDNTKPDDQNLSKYDRKVSKQLEKIYNLWSAVDTEDGVEYRNPANKREVKRSEKILQRININKCSSKAVIERYKDLKGVVKYARDNLPTFGKHLIFSIISFLLIVSALLFANQMYDFKKEVGDFSQNDWTVIENTYLRFDAFMDGSRPEIIKGNVIKKGQEVTPVATIGKWVQVKTRNGEKGFLYYKDLAGSKTAEVKSKVQLQKTPGDLQSTDSLSTGDIVTVLGFQKKNDEKYPYYVKIRSSYNKVGIIPTYKIEYPFLIGLPELSQTYKLPTTYKTMEDKTVQKKIEKVEDIYGPATSIIKTNDGYVAYFRHIELIKDGEKYKGVLLHCSPEKEIKSLEVTNQRKLTKIDKLPLSNFLRNQEVFGINKTSFYYGGKNVLDYFNFFQNSNWFLKILGFIIKVVAWFLVMFVILSIPRIFIIPFTHLLLYARFLSNGFVILFEFIIWVFTVYLAILWFGILLDGLFLPLILYLPILIFWQYRFNQKILYNRCKNCHTMNSAEDKGSTFLGRSKEVSWGTYDVYKGSTTSFSGNAKTEHYERRKQKTEKTYDNYMDHRKCVICGYEWDIKRRNSVGSKTTKY